MQQEQAEARKYWQTKTGSLFVASEVDLAKRTIDLEKFQAMKAAESDVPDLDGQILLAKRDITEAKLKSSEYFHREVVMQEERKVGQLQTWRCFPVQEGLRHEQLALNLQFCGSFGKDASLQRVLMLDANNRTTQ